MNQVRFNNREWQSELDLNVTDMDFRQYNNDIGRFVTTDAITHYSQSPYHFANNNPMYFADPSGADGVVPNFSSTVYGMAGQTASSNPFPRGHDSFGNAPIRSGGGIFWGSTQSQYEQSWEAHNGVQTFYGADAVNILRGYSSIWHEGSVTTYSASAGDPNLNGETLYSVNLGFWEKVKESYQNIISPILRKTFDNMEVYGGSAEAIGLMAAPFTEGGSLVLAEYGFQLSLYGTLGNTSMDFLEGKTSSGIYRLAKFSISAGMGRAFDAIPLKNLPNMLNGYKTLLETHVIPAIEDSWNKFNSNHLKI